MPTNIIQQLCAHMEACKASDLFLSAGRYPAFRIGGTVVEQNTYQKILPEQIQEFVHASCQPGTWQQLLTEKDLDCGITIPNLGRFRLNLSFQRGNPSIAIRRIPPGALDHRKFFIPDEIVALADEARGLILVTGATNSGKSTTLNVLLHHINSNAAKHIVTIEDPIEYAHEDIKSVVSQREIGTDTKDFATALKHVVRQNPDAIFIGEMRDMTTIQTAISAAMTGHLVCATMHAIDATQTVEKILTFFPEAIKEQIANDLAHTLIGIVAQRLLPRRDKPQERIPAFDFLKLTPLARRLIANQELVELPEVLKAGVQEGMTTFNRSILKLFQDGFVDFEAAKQAASNKDEFLLLVQGMETGIDTFRNYSTNQEQGISIKKLLKDSIHYKASDLILTAGSPPTVRIDGELRPFDMPILAPADTQKLLYSILSYVQRANFEQNKEIDFALAFKEDSIANITDTNIRFRVNGFYQKGAVAVVIRLIPTVIPSLPELELPPIAAQLCTRKQGLVLVTGPTGSGKSTTLAAMINQINHTRACHIITVEDPIEFVHKHHASLVEQREVHADTLDFNNALKYVLRQDPDIILVGEMRDPETIATVLTAAETGHLVFATLHTNDVTQSVDRIVDVFPADRQNQVRSQLASCLEAIISQRLLKRTGTNGGRIAAFEVLVGTTAVKALIREQKTHQLLGIMEASAKDGMITMERALQNLLQAGKISREDYLTSLPGKYNAFNANPYGA